MWHRGLKHKLSNYGISKRALSIIKSFVTYKFLKVVVTANKQKPLRSMSAFHRGLSAILGYFDCINMPNNLLRSLVSIYDTIVYTVQQFIRALSKNLEDQNLATHLSSGVTQAVQWGKNWLVKCNTAKTNLTSKVPP